MGLDTKLSVLIFVFVLIAYTAQTLLAQYVQQEIHYRKPYFLLYMTHSGYVLLLPLHLLSFYLLKIPIDEQLSILRGVLRIQYGPDHGVSRHHMKEEILPSSSAPSRSESRPGIGRSLSRASIDARPRSKRRTSLRRLLGKKAVGDGRKAWKWRLAYTTVKLTLLIATPALLWYAAVPMTSMTDITAIYNTFAFWAGLLAIKFLGEKPTKIKLASVILATLGVFVIAYGDAYLSSSPPKAPKEPITDYPPDRPQKRDENPQGSERFIGNMLALAGSIAYAYYEVWYALKVALPTSAAGLGNMDVDEDDDEEVAEGLLHAEESSGAEDSNISNYTQETASSDTVTPASHSNLRALSISSVSIPPRSVTNPSPMTFLLYSNLLTTLIGLATLTLLWIPIPFLHWFGWEIFEVPPLAAQLPIVGIILSGVCFNGGFMVLLSAWGPVMAVSVSLLSLLSEKKLITSSTTHFQSVGNLCTLVLVAVADSVFPPHNILSLWSAIGSGMVVGAFVLLVIGGHGEEPEAEDEYTNFARD